MFSAFTPVKILSSSRRMSTMGGNSGVWPQMPINQVLLLNKSQPQIYETAKKEFFDLKKPYGTIRSLWEHKENQKAVNSFMWNKFVREQAYYPENPLNKVALEEYLLQDYLYLLENVNFREKRLASIPRDQSGHFDLERAGIEKLKTYIENKFLPVLEKLRIKNRITEVQPCEALKEYIARLDEQTQFGSFYDLYTIYIPCGYGWSHLFVELYQDPNTVKKGTFWNDVIMPNVEDYFEYKKEVVGEDGQKTWVVDREFYEGCLSSTARRLGEWVENYPKDENIDQEKVRANFRLFLQMECNFWDASFDLAKKRMGVENGKDPEDL